METAVTIQCEILRAMDTFIERRQYSKTGTKRKEKSESVTENLPTKKTPPDGFTREL